ncbi:DNA-directed RNA polymerase subunit beta [Nocardia farcinica]|uniref:DNA-directed RNA polymerase subunit beta n=1 Tax=Nocardia farcinica TaxID=37329 RepID=UPI0009CDAF62|nr:DNA-directed RNA polymerase subunit beta [Nocardia farcinica]MBF6248967.1 DNA-directed RNA polymerase subunit beta [Nocardia farcinica]SLH49284.1 Uncharacterised protein [Mycobacteroides abscessus subsp. abscessus]
MGIAYSSDTVITRCDFYRRCGLPAEIDPSGELITFRTGNIGAITVPSALAAQVRLHLRDRGIDGGPIISHLRSKRWTFVVIPGVPDQWQLEGELFRLNVSVAGAGAEIALPAPTPASAAVRCWVQGPAGRSWPSGATVIEALRSWRSKAAWVIE